MTSNGVAHITKMRTNNLEKRGCNDGKCARQAEGGYCIHHELFVKGFKRCIHNNKDAFYENLTFLNLIAPVKRSSLVLQAINRVPLSQLETFCRLCTVALLWSEGGGWRSGGHNIQMTVFQSTLSPIIKKLQPCQSCTQYPKCLLKDREEKRSSSSWCAWIYCVQYEHFSCLWNLSIH